MILGGSHTWYMVARRQVVEGESGEQCRLEPHVPTWGMVLEFKVIDRECSKKVESQARTTLYRS